MNIRKMCAYCFSSLLLLLGLSAGRGTSQQSSDDWDRSKEHFETNCKSVQLNIDLGTVNLTTFNNDTTWTSEHLSRTTTRLNFDSTATHLTLLQFEQVRREEQLEEVHRKTIRMGNETSWIKHTTNLPLKLDGGIGKDNRKLLLAIEKRELARVYSSLAMVLLDSDPVHTRHWKKVHRAGHRMVRKHCSTRTVLNPNTVISRLVTSAEALTSSLDTKHRLVDYFLRQMSATWNRLEKRYFAEFLLNYSQKLRKVALRHLS